MRRPVTGLAIACVLMARSLAAQPIAAASPPQPAPAQAPASSSSAQSAQETIVVTATAAPTPLGNVGRAVDVLTRDEIDAIAAGSVADLLRQISSVDVRARGPFGAQTDFSLRGAGFGQTLVLVDGVRLNDAQTGHHNGDLPVTLADIERIEVVRGAGSSLHGADAFGGTINIITRQAQPGFTAAFDRGQHGLVDAGITIGLRQGSVAHRVSGTASQSDGFMPDRDHDIYNLDYRADAGHGLTFAAAHANKEFGAAGFYGPAPSREWTKQTLVRAEDRWLQRDRWASAFQIAYRDHRDRFVYNQDNPALSDNRHRTRAVSGELRVHHAVSNATLVSVGVAGGGDWIRSSNLGNHDFARGSVFVELQQRLGQRVMVSPGVRFDSYSRFGSAWSPSVAVTGWMSSRVKLRASGGHAFRVPTFTELYYTDPSNLGNPDLKSETAWTADAGVDIFGSRGWSASVTGFGRWESNVIDWVRATAAERWQTTNVRDVQTHGVELGVRRRFGTGGDVGVQYTWQQLDATPLGLLSKYVLDYAPHTLAFTASRRLGGWGAAPSLQFKRRVDGQDYCLVDLRLTRQLGGRWELYADGTNLLNSSYYEITGVPMPGRWLRFGLRRR